MGRRTSLDMLAALGALNARLAQRYVVRLAVRIGIHTGLVVVGEMGRAAVRNSSLWATLLTLPPAFRGSLCRIRSSSVLLHSGSSEDIFSIRTLGHTRSKGLTTPMQAYRILGDSAAQSRLDVVGATGLTPLIGRDSEVALLLERWVLSQDRAGEVVLLHGEAGIGQFSPSGGAARACDQGAGGASDLAGDLRAYPARTHILHRPGHSAGGHQRLWCRRGGTMLHAVRGSYPSRCERAHSSSQC